MRISQENLCQIVLKTPEVKQERVVLQPGQEIGGFESIENLDDFSSQLNRVVANNYLIDHPTSDASFHWFKTNHLSSIVDKYPKKFHGRRELKVIIQEPNTKIIKKIEGVDLSSMISFQVVSRLISNNQWEGNTYTDVSIYIRNIKRENQVKPYLTMSTFIPEKNKVQKNINERNFHSTLNWYQLIQEGLSKPLPGGSPQ